VDRALAVDPWFLWNSSGKREIASIARLVFPLSSDCGCRVSDSATSCEERAVEKDAVLMGTTTPSKVAVALAAVGVGIIWLFVALMMLSFILISAAVVSGLLPVVFSVPPFTIHIFLMCVAVVIFCGSTYLFIAFTSHCPHCGFKFLKNPKGLGPTGFVYHRSCPRRRGLNPWAVQIGRFLAIHKIRCINCGQEVIE
jgi:hypothetical protein